MTTPLRRLSGRVFGGAEFRAEIALAVAGQERVCKKDLQAHLQAKAADAPSLTTVGNEVDVLAEARLIEPEDPSSRSGKKYWVPDSSSSYWRFCEELKAEADRRTTD